MGIALRHVVRNALGPIVTNLGLDMAYFLGGVLVIETVFGSPGVGLLGYEAISYQDVPMNGWWRCGAAVGHRLVDAGRTPNGLYRVLMCERWPTSSKPTAHGPLRPRMGVRRMTRGTGKRSLQGDQRSEQYRECGRASNPLRGVIDKLLGSSA